MIGTPNDTIVALATAVQNSAIAIIRLSGPEAISIVDAIFFGRNLEKVAGKTIHYGKIKGGQEEIVDEVLVNVFRQPKSYTGEDIVEINCHASPYIVEQIIALCLKGGARQAEPGEFTMRAYLNGQLDLSQAEAVADVIAATNARQHELAMHQLRGGITAQMKDLRGELIDFAALLELENDFGEEDVEFANREKLRETVDKISGVVGELIDSFKYGNAIKNGLPIAIVGAPNVGKSTLLNALLKEEKAIVSPIAGTTRDVIEDVMQIEGMTFRFMDTAGLHETTDVVENIGIDRTRKSIEKASLVLYLDEVSQDFEAIIDRFRSLDIPKRKQVILVLNKLDDFHACHGYDVEEAIATILKRPVIAISAKSGLHQDKLKELILAKAPSVGQEQDVILSNIRHKQALEEALEDLQKVSTGLQEGQFTDLIALDLRHALDAMGRISGEVSTDDLLDSIFSNFCIGK